MKNTYMRTLALYEDARGEANIALWSIKLQIYRLDKNELEIPEFVMQPITDFHFLITSLTRLRKMAELVSETVNISPEIEKFDKAIPDLKGMRNVLEHLDEYRLGKGFNKMVDTKGLRTMVLGQEKIKWLNYELDINGALKASIELFEAIKQNTPGDSTSMR